MQAKSLLNYGEIGIKIHLTPHNSCAPYFHVDPYQSPASQIIVVEDQADRKVRPTPPLGCSYRVTV